MKENYTKEIINSYFLKYINDENTIAILITGSCGRDENDYLSDIDWVRIVKKNEGLSGFKEEYGNILFDCRCEEYNDIAKNEWYMDQYYAYLNCKIYYDKNDAFSNLLTIKKEDWKEYIKKLIAIKLVECSVYLKFPKNNLELYVPTTHYERFILRNDLDSAYNCLKIINLQLIDLCYLCNNQPIPDDKNKFRNMKKYDFSHLLSKLVVIPCNKNVNSMNEVYQQYMKILQDILICYREKINFSESAKKYYYKYRGTVR